MDCSDFDVNSYRRPHESDNEWTLKRSFLEAHKDKYTRSRLLCLASCFLNVECYGNRYPEPVMAELRQLSEELHDVLEEHRSSVKGFTQMKFVKASEVKFVRGSSDSTSAAGSASSSSKPVKSAMTFVKASDDYESTKIHNEKDSSEMAPKDGEGFLIDQMPKGMQRFGLGAGKGSVKHAMKQFSQECQSQQSEEEVGKFYQLANRLRELKSTKTNPVELVHMVAQKCHMQSTVDFKSDKEQKFICEMYIDCILVSKGVGTNKKSAKANAYENAIHVLCKPYLTVNKSDPNCAILEASFEPVETQQSHSFKSNRNFNMGMTKLGHSTQSNVNPLGKGRKRKAPHFANLSDIIIMEPGYLEEVNSLMVLQQTVAINKVDIEFEFRDTPVGVVCTINIGGTQLAEMTSTNKNEAKQLAADIALGLLKEMCWTIKIKQKYEANDDSVSREELVGDIQKSMEAIPETNIGNQLLKKMGWVGGGVGKSGQGIAEPVKVDAVINRSGLGLQAEQGISKNFLPQIRTILNQYAKSNERGDLTFSAEFLKEERAMIHKEAQKIGLKSHSHGKGDNRFLVISRKMSVEQILQHILECGGETQKYKVEPPGSSVG